MMDNLILQLIIYLVCFLLVWLGSDLVVSTIAGLSNSWRLPRFIISFIFLGLLTSLPELTIGIASIANDDPQIVAGNLLGGIIVMFLGVIPLLGVLGNGIKIPSQLNKRQLISTLIVVVAPAFLTADQKLGKWEGMFLIVLYLGLVLSFSMKQSYLDKAKNIMNRKKKRGAGLILKILVGMLLLIGASYQIVNSTIYFADILSISPFFVSLIVVAIGTNIPEISIAIRSVLSKKKDIALADYLGSASVNSLLFGIFTLMYGETIQLPNHFLQRFSFLAIGLILFYFFARSRNHLSRKECAVLLCLYLGFVVVEIMLMTSLAG